MERRVESKSDEKDDEPDDVGEGVDEVDGRQEIAGRMCWVDLLLSRGFTGRNVIALIFEFDSFRFRLRDTPETL